MYASRPTSLKLVSTGNTCGSVGMHTHVSFCAAVWCSAELRTSLLSGVQQSSVPHCCLVFSGAPYLTAVWCSAELRTSLLSGVQRSSVPHCCLVFSGAPYLTAVWFSAEFCLHRLTGRICSVLMLRYVHRNHSVY